MKRHLFISLALLSSGLCVSAQTLSSYQAAVRSQGPNFYFTFDGGSLTDSTGHGITLLSSPSGNPYPQVAYDVFRNPANAAYFSAATDTLVDLNETTDNIITGAGSATTTSTAAGSVSFLFKSLSSGSLTAQKYIFCAGFTNTYHNALSLFFENTNVANGDPQSLKLRFGDHTTVILQASDVVPDTWYYFAFTYTEATNGYWFPNPSDTQLIANENGLITNCVAIKGKWYLGPAGGTLFSDVTTNAVDSVAGQGLFYIGNRSDTKSSGYRSPGNGVVDEFATWSRRLSSTEVSNQFAALPPLLPPGATYQQVVASEVPKYWFKLDNSLVESVGNTLVLSTNGTNGAFTTDFYGNPNSAYSFSKTNDALFITSDLINGGGPGASTTANGKGTISFLFRMLSDTNNDGQRYLFAAPSTSANKNQLGLFLESANPSSGGNSNSLKLRVGNTTKGNLGVTDPVPVAYPTDLVSNAWYYFAMTYDESRDTPEVYVYFGRAGGTLTSTSFNPANDSVVGDNGPLWIGNRETLSSGFRGPGQGAIDEFALWDYELSPADIQAQFASLVLPPTLGIAVAGTDAVVSWPSSAVGFTLQTNANLASPSWSSAGTPVVVGGQYVVTNRILPNARFYRLKK